MRRSDLWLLFFVLVIGGCFWYASAVKQQQAEQLTEAAFAYTPANADTPVKPSLTAETLYELVKPAAKLVSATDQYVNTDTISDHAKPLGINLDYRPFRDEVQFTYRGTICFGIDLSDVTFDVNQASRVIYVTLPAPTIVSHAIDTSSFVFDTKHDSWFAEIDPEVFVARANTLKHQQELQAIASGDAIREASSSAESTLSSLLTASSVTDGYQLRFFTAN